MNLTERSIVSCDYLSYMTQFAIQIKDLSLVYSAALLLAALQLDARSAEEK